MLLTPGYLSTFPKVMLMALYLKASGVILTPPIIAGVMVLPVKTIFIWRRAGITQTYHQYVA